MSLKTQAEYIEIVERHIIQSGSGNPIKLEALIQELGIELDKKHKFEDETVGSITKLDEDKYLIKVKKGDFYFRQRFTMAHEVGHFMLHRHLLDVGDSIEDNTLFRSPNQPKIGEALEIEANRFAASMLMPLSKVQEDYRKLKDVKKVAAKWQVSPQAMKIRLGLT